MESKEPYFVLFSCVTDVVELLKQVKIFLMHFLCGTFVLQLNN